ncbi:hypothetical protein [Streptacidiphilus fuscans]|uniref:Uncharacterized protein n=1 Tax=Streptacidiphilus fuscans TaxID=2789292 RepID=A0A931B395_9ACTN|nr:hypothetical protein [Streptacidiphilus fuscans]MBF9069493.1 hypothetical protein [Streptacidiphilus fuscans]
MTTRRIIAALTLAAAFAVAVPFAASLPAQPAKAHAVASQIKWGLGY